MTNLIDLKPKRNELEFLRCECGGQDFRVVYTSFGDLKGGNIGIEGEPLIRIPTDCQHYCIACGSMVDGICFNTDIVEEPSHTHDS